MPVQPCQSDGLPGFRWGEAGKCFTYEPGDEAGRNEARRRAILQGIAIGEGELIEERVKAARLLQHAWNEGDEEIAQAVVQALWEEAQDEGDTVLAQLMCSLQPELGMSVRKDSLEGPNLNWRPPIEVGNMLAIPGGLPANMLHVTIAQVAAAGPDMTMSDRYWLDRIAYELAIEWVGLEGTISGTGRFQIAPDIEAFFLTVDVPGLEQYHIDAVEKITEVGLPVVQRGFVPHITLTFQTPGSGDPAIPEGVIGMPIFVDSFCLSVPPHDVAFWPMFGDMEPEGEEVAEVERAGASRAWPLRRLGRKQLPEDEEDDPPPGVEYALDKALELIAETKKRGRVLSSKNEKKIKQALELIQSVLSQLETDEEKKASIDVDGEKGTVEMLAKNDEMRFTLGVVYSPDAVDAHGEFTTARALQDAVHNFMKAGDLRLRLQHDTSKEIGDIVEMFTLPADAEFKLQIPEVGEKVVSVNEGTVLMGVIWEKAAWPLVKSGAIAGFSLGGRAARVEVDRDLPDMSDQ